MDRKLQPTPVGGDHPKTGSCLRGTENRAPQTGPPNRTRKMHVAGFWQPPGGRPRRRRLAAGFAPALFVWARMGVGGPIFFWGDVGRHFPFLGGATRCCYQVALPGGAAGWRYQVVLPGGAYFLHQKSGPSNRVPQTSILMVFRICWDSWKSQKKRGAPAGHLKV